MPGLRPEFRNVDLEIVSISNLESIAEEMGDRVSVLYCGLYEGRRKLLAVEAAGVVRKPDAAIHALCKVIESLSPESRRIWDRAKKVFDIGCDLHPAPNAPRIELRPDTQVRAAALGAAIGFTAYPSAELRRALSAARADGQA